MTFSFLSPTVRLSSTETFDAFMLQVRGRRRRNDERDDEDEDDDGIFYAGSFTDVPGVAKIIKCGQNRFAAVAGNPFRNSQWKSLRCMIIDKIICCYIKTRVAPSACPT